MIKTFRNARSQKYVPPLLFYQELEEEVCSIKIRE